MTALTSPLERLLLRDSAIVIASLTGLTLLAWAYLILLSAGMAAGDMSLVGMAKSGAMEGMNLGGATTMMPQPWSLVTLVLMLVMWWIMMIGMMVPSAAPMVLLFARIQGKKLPAEGAVRRTALFSFGYVLLWLAFSVAATLLQWGLTAAALMSPMMASASPVLGAAILATAGVYQLTPLKHACLEHCRSPIGFLSTHWRKGKLGALRMGLDHGAYCVGCCWFLMALLFVGGVMNLLWVAAIAILVLLEKIVPWGARIARLSGTVMLGFAVFQLVMG